MDYDAGILELGKKCNVFSELYDVLGYLEQRKREVSFASFVETIVSQQLSGKAANTIMSRVRFVVGTDVEASVVAGLDPQCLMDVGVSRAKTEYVIGLAKMFSDGELSIDSLANLPDSELFERLVQLRGIGPWSARILMLFNFGRLNAFPFGDVTLEKTFESLTGHPKSFLESYVQTWSPYSGVVAMYMWSYADRIT